MAKELSCAFGGSKYTVAVAFEPGEIARPSARSPSGLVAARYVPSGALDLVMIRSEPPVLAIRISMV